MFIIIHSLWVSHPSHLFATNHGFSRIRQDKTTDAFKKNCLAASVPSDDSIYFSGCDTKAHMVQNRLFPRTFLLTSCISIKFSIL